MRLLAVGATLLAAAVSIAPESLLMGYLGGSGTDDCDGITVDRAGDIYLGCHSDSPDFPHLPTKAAPTSNASMDAVVVKIEARTGRIVWATRTGGSDWDAAGELAVAKDGSVYVLGQTQSPDFPTTPDAVQRKFAGPRRDVFVLKLDANGKIVYSTLLGGSKNDEATAFALADDGTVYVGGATWSDDFPGVRGGRFGPGGVPDGFIAQLRPGDPASLHTVRIGGKGRDPIASLALDHAGNLFAAGYTNAPDFPVKNALQPKFGGGDLDAYLTKWRVSDWSLLFSTYLGGTRLDGAGAVAVDSSGNPVVSGVTASDDFVTTPGAFQTQLRGKYDEFVTKFDRDGGRVLWSTHYGGSAKSELNYASGGMAIDENGRVWIDGMTAATDLPTRNAFQPSYGGGDLDGFLAALSSDGSRLCYGTYIGGKGRDLMEGLVAGKGRVYASGLAASAGPAQKGWHVQAGHGGGPFDAIVVGIDITRLPK